MSGLLHDKVVIVTGGGHGIGRAYCLGITREGGRVAVADIDATAAKQVALEVERQSGEAIAVEVDVANLASCQDMTKRTMDRFGRIDGLINNAAIFMTIPVGRAGFQEISEADWDRVMNVNVKGVWYCCRAVAPVMQEQGSGSIVNIATNMVFNGSPERMHYVTSKAAIVGFSRVLARELGPSNIRVNSLAPGSTMSEEEPTDDAIQRYQRTASNRALKRVEVPEDLVGSALYLMSDLSSFVTGETILVNGGDVLH